MARIILHPIHLDGEPRRWAISARVTGHDLADAITRAARNGDSTPDMGVESP